MILDLYAYHMRIARMGIHIAHIIRNHKIKSNNIYRYIFFCVAPPALNEIDCPQEIRSATKWRPMSRHTNRKKFFSFYYPKWILNFLNASISKTTCRENKNCTKK